MNYDFLVPDDSLYRVELYFTEPWLGRSGGLRTAETSNDSEIVAPTLATDAEGERIFSIAINDSIVQKDLDVWAESGTAGALKKVYYVHGRGNKLIISFPEVKAGEAVISAIAIAKPGRSNINIDAAGPVMSDSYWQDLDKDTIAKCSKELLPKDSEAFPSVKYKPTAKAEWTISPGVAREYALRFRVKNTTGEAVIGRLQVTDSKGALLVDRDITIPTTPNKFKTLATTTGTQINAGFYKVVIKIDPAVDFDYLEVQ